MIERRQWVGVYILCLGLAGVLGCSKKADLKIVDLTTSEGTLLERPISGSSQVNVKIRNFANGPLTISRGAGPGAYGPIRKDSGASGLKPVIKTAANGNP